VPAPPEVPVAAEERAAPASAQLTSQPTA
jgi:hypothetical protein